MSAAPITGRLVLAADPEVEIRGPCDMMPATTDVETATVIGTDLEIEYSRSGYENFDEATVTLTDRRGVMLYLDRDGEEHPEDALAIVDEAGELHPIPTRRGVVHMMTTGDEVTISRALLSSAAEYIEKFLNLNGEPGDGDCAQVLEKLNEAAAA